MKSNTHDVGKDLATAMLHASGFKVIDIGVDLPAKMFAEAVRDASPISWS